MADWSREDLETLAACIDEGLTTAQARRRLPRRSRNAIAGKAKRLGWRFGKPRPPGAGSPGGPATR